MRLSIWSLILILVSFGTINAQPPELQRYIQSQWQHNKLPGGAICEVMVVDETINEGDVQGLVIIDKSGNTGWIPWSGTTFGTPQSYNEYHPWHMGGDVKKIGDDLYVVTATMHGRHLMKYNTTTDAWDNLYPTESLKRSGYHQFSPPAFTSTG